jgi:DNA-binding CsgD family transcriptional regulator
MSHKPDPIGTRPWSAFRLDPALTGEEAIVLRALAGGQTDRQVCKQLHMAVPTFHRIMRDMREKTGTASNVALIVWATRQIKGVDQRIDRPERYARLA